MRRGRGEAPPEAALGDSRRREVWLSGPVRWALRPGAVRGAGGADGERLDALERMAGGVAHEFNNLLMAIEAQCALLEEGPPGREDPTEAAREIRRSVSRAAALTRQLLIFSRRQPVSPRRLDLNDVIRRLEPWLQRALGTRFGLDLRLTPAPALICADACLLEQVLVNLVLNAREAMEQSGQVVVETRHVDGELGSRRGPDTGQRWVCLSVADTGVGIRPELHGRIFEPFFTTKEAGQGCGLGLAAALGIVRASGGHIEVSSEPGQGAAFTVYLPRVDPEP
ncbi:MAG: ATP-binding protein [Acidobacteriota bacterium]|nr:ATP-binding protein [Acidobacteriota bacterium]